MGTLLPGGRVLDRELDGDQQLAGLRQRPDQSGRHIADLAEPPSGRIRAVQDLGESGEFRVLLPAQLDYADRDLVMFGRGIRRRLPMRGTECHEPLPVGGAIGWAIGRDA